MMMWSRHPLLLRDVLRRSSRTTTIIRRDNNLELDRMSRCLCLNPQLMFPLGAWSILWTPLKTCRIKPSRIFLISGITWQNRTSQWSSTSTRKNQKAIKTSTRAWCSYHTATSLCGDSACSTLEHRRNHSYSRPPATKHQTSSTSSLLTSLKVTKWA